MVGCNTCRWCPQTGAADFCMQMRHSPSANLATRGRVRKKLQVARDAERILTVAMTQSAATGQNGFQGLADTTQN